MKNAFITISILTFSSTKKSMTILIRKNNFFVKRTIHLHKNQLVKKFRIISMCSCLNENVSIRLTKKKIIEHRIKITRTITILSIYNAIKNETNKWIFLIKSNYDLNHENKFVISISKTYKQIIKNSIWKNF